MFLINANPKIPDGKSSLTLLVHSCETPVKSGKGP